MPSFSLSERLVKPVPSLLNDHFCHDLGHNLNRLNLWRWRERSETTHYAWPGMVDTSSCSPAWYMWSAWRSHSEPWLREWAGSVIYDWNWSTLDGNIGFTAGMCIGRKCTATNGSIGVMQRRFSFSIPSTSREDPPCTGEWSVHPGDLNILQEVWKI